MDNEKFTIVDENGSENSAEIITAFSYKNREYAIYSIDRDEENVNIFVSRIIKDENNMDVLEDIDDDNEKEEINNVVKEILSTLE